MGERVLRNMRLYLLVGEGVEGCNRRVDARQGGYDSVRRGGGDWPTSPHGLPQPRVRGGGCLATPPFNPCVTRFIKLLPV